ncbi:MAG TPA: ABC transporter permease [Sedimentibacter sp.]|nr:ABC transporter permease [Sedimentibacter sp.]HOK48770.1 ABC transporter permease [Sedimentibacter sp.]HRC81499.1 ABC transporter permease [Sedimentibacter sp.]
MAKEVWRNYKKSPSAMLGLVILVVIIILAIVAQVIFDYDEDIVQQNIMNRLQKPSAEHIFGTDQYGRDIFARILYGAKYSLSVGIVSVAISCFIGSTLGLIAGYYGGRLENIILRTCEVFVGIPSVLLGIAIMAAFGQSIVVLMLAIGLVYVPMFARTARAAVLPVRDQEYIEAAKVSGVSDFRIIFTHVLPNSMSPIIVQVTMGVANGILTASQLSFLGLGIPVPAPEWGAMLSSGREFIRDYSYLTFFPGLAIMITVLAFNLMGDGLRDALDPKLKQ